VDFETGAVHDQVQRLCPVDVSRKDSQTDTATTERRVIWDGDVDAEHIGNRPQQSFGLTQWLVERQAYCQGSFDGERRIDWLTASPPGGRGPPLSYPLVGKPH